MEGLINKMKNIHRDPSLSPRGLAPGTAKKTSSKRHIPGGLLPGHGRMRSGHQSLGGIAASPASLINKRFTLPFLALLAALAVGLLFLLPGGPLRAQEATTELEYAENGTDPVATFTGIDPEGRPVYWSLPATLPESATTVDGMVLVATNYEDNDSFMISADGVLTFKFSPNYEMSTSVTSANVYNVVVVASDDAPGAGDMSEMAYHKVTVTVTDVDEDGSISLSAQQPQVDVDLTATLTDQDARSITTLPIINAKWKWEQGTAMNGPWSLISGAGAGADAADVDTKASDGYEPAADTVGKYLRRPSPTPTNMARTRPRWRCRPTWSGRCPLEATLRLSSQTQMTMERTRKPER